MQTQPLTGDSAEQHRLKKLRDRVEQRRILAAPPAEADLDRLLGFAIRFTDSPGPPGGVDFDRSNLRSRRPQSDESVGGVDQPFYEPSHRFGSGTQSYDSVGTGKVVRSEGTHTAGRGLGGLEDRHKHRFWPVRECSRKYISGPDGEHRSNDSAIRQQS